MLGDSQHAVDLRASTLGIVQHGRRRGQLLKDAELRVIRTYLVVNERMPSPLFHAGRAADHDDRRLLRVGLSGRIRHFQPTNAIRDADDTKPVEPRIRVGGKACSLFVAGGDQLNRALLQFVHEGKHKVAWHAEDMADSMLL